MKNLWQQLKPEHKQSIKKHQENYSSAPQGLEKILKKECAFCFLTVEQMRDLFIWTNEDITDIKWQDIYGDHFLIKDNTGIEL